MSADRITYQGPPEGVKPLAQPQIDLRPAKKAALAKTPMTLIKPSEVALVTDPQFKFPRRMTVGAHQKLADLNFDPLEWSVRIAKGEALTTDHPFLKFLQEWWLDLCSNMTKGNPIAWEVQVEQMLDKATTSLSDSWVPLNLRSQHIIELMGYLYPKLKAVEHSGSIKSDMSSKPLTADEVKLFKEYFNDEY